MPVTIETIASLSDISEAEWDNLNPHHHPFTSYGFLHALEKSGSVGAETGWDPLYLVAKDEQGRLIGALPHYVKYHSYGEYVFDHAWANAFERAGGRYYPKLLGAVPFTPVPGPRLLYAQDRPDAASALLEGVERLLEKHQISSAHINFLSEEDKHICSQRGWLVRSGIQFHWHNHGYQTFDDFLNSLSSRKRKNIKKERASLAQQNISFCQYSADTLTPEIWDVFYQFYLSTVEKKWGGAYLTEDFFPLIGEKMADRILLVVAYQQDIPIAAALNFKGHDALYGRNWGCSEEIPNLHFETCYYQAIEFAIRHGLSRVEAGAQGFHKVQRGYLPSLTYSAHKLQHPGMEDAVARFLRHEEQQIHQEAEAITAASPFKSSQS